MKKVLLLGMFLISMLGSKVFAGNTDANIRNESISNIVTGTKLVVRHSPEAMEFAAQELAIFEAAYGCLTSTQYNALFDMWATVYDSF